jgi:DNA modification methylase
MRILSRKTNVQSTKNYSRKVIKKREGYSNRKDRGDAGGFSGIVKYSESYEPDKKLPETIIRISKDDYGKNIFHPTQKPVALMEYLIRTYSNEGETILDNTMGSGTTGIACVNTKRNFIGIEQDPKYFKIASERIDSAIDAMEL